MPLRMYLYGMNAHQFVIAGLFCPSFLFAQETLSLNEVWNSGLFFPSSANGFDAMQDGKHYLVLEEDLLKYHFEKEAPTDTFQFYVGSERLIPETYELSSDENRILLGTDLKSIYRYSTQGIYFWANLKDGQAQRLGGGPISYPSFSPDNRHLVFQKGNNLFLKNVENGTERAITTDGEKNAIIHGSGDWVYEEEFSLVKAYEFSEKGSWLAWLRFDEREVPEYNMTMFQGQLYPTDYRFKYPKVGQPNSRVDLMVCQLPEGQPKRIPMPLHLEYVPRIVWKGDGELLLMGLNRLQNHLWLYSVNPTDATFRLVYEDSSNTYLEIPDPIVVVPGTSDVILTSERSGFKHLYRVNVLSGQIVPLTSGNWEVTGIVGYHEKSKEVFFSSTEFSVTEQKICAVDAKGKRRMPISTLGQQAADLCGDYLVLTYSEAHRPYRSDLYSLKGKRIKNLVNNEDLEEEYARRRFTKPEFLQVPAADGSALNAYLIKPSSFSPQNRYGLLMYVYGGPGSQLVQNDWLGPNYGWFQYLASQGILVACVDNRGTGGRGKSFRDITYGRLGEIETADQLAAVDWFAGQPWIDSTRIGYFGWSYGGYMSALCVLKGAGKIRASVSVAPVTNWKFYDNIYTERYMGTLETNPKGFDAQSPISMAANLEGALLLIHGSGDDNVHWQNAAELSSALVKANKDFEQFIYPDKNHGIYGGATRSHLYRKMSKFILEHLGGSNHK